MALDGDLGGTDRGEGVDHSESVATTRRDREDLQRSVGHKSGVGVSELALAVNEERLGILASVYSQSTWISFGGIFVQPITDHHDVGGQIKVIQVAVGISGRRLTDNNTAVHTVHLLKTCVSVPEMGSRITCPLISERVSLLNWTLRNKRYSIVVLGSSLPDSVPMDSRLHALHMVLHIDNHLVVFAHLNTGSRDHPVRRQDTTFHAIGQHALTVTPHGVGGVRGAHLAGTVTRDK